jgi:hypothetical protein
MITRKIHAVAMVVIATITMLIGQTPIPNDTTIEAIIANKNLPSTLSVSSLPTSAEIYIDKKPGKRTSPDGYTPETFTNLKNKEIILTLFKKGYSDTTLYLDLTPATTNNINITMVPPHVKALEAQDRFLRDRFLAKIGKYCLISSPVFLAAGAGFLYYSEKNRKKAEEARSYLDRTIIHYGAEFDAMQQQYTYEKQKRNSRFVSGIVLSGLAAIDLGLGIVLYF